MRLFAFFALLMLAVPLAASAQTSATQADRKEVIRLLGQLPDIAPIREDFRALGYRGANLELAVKQAKLMYRDPVIAGYVADRVIAAFEAPQSVGAADGLIWPLIQRGLGHLSTGELKFYYTVEQSMLEALSVRQCGLAVRDKMPPDQFAEMTSRVAARLNTDALKEYYRIQAKAARFGAKRKPVIQGESTVRRIEERVQSTMTRSIEASKNPGRMLAAMVNLEQAGNTQACAIGRLFMNTVMQLEGRALRETLVYMSRP